MAKRIAPTKGNLILVKEELILAQEAYELLDRKREVLINELMRYMHELREVQDRFHEKFVKALVQFRMALARMGQADMNRALDFPMVENEFNILHRSVMGVHVLELSIAKPATQPMPGPAQSTPELEEAGALMREALEVLGDYVTKIGSVWRLANEVKKTQRRVNARPMTRIVVAPRMPNVLDALPKRVQPRAKGMLHEAMEAPTRAEADRAIDAFVGEFEPKWPKAAAKLTKDRSELLAFYASRPSTGATCARRIRSRAPSRPSSCARA